MKALWLSPLVLIACAPSPVPLPATPAGPVAVPFSQYAPAPQPLSEDVVLSLPAGVPAGDVFVAPDGCYFFLQGEALMILTEGTSTTPLCRAP